MRSWVDSVGITGLQRQLGWPWGVQWGVQGFTGAGPHYGRLRDPGVRPPSPGGWEQVLQAAWDPLHDVWPGGRVCQTPQPPHRRLSVGPSN